MRALMKSTLNHNERGEWDTIVIELEKADYPGESRRVTESQFRRKGPTPRFPARGKVPNKPSSRRCTARAVLADEVNKLGYRPSWPASCKNNKLKILGEPPAR